jgi:chemotaxis protein MotC
VRPFIRNAVALAGLAVAQASAAQAEPDQISDLTDKLQQIQVRVALGDKGAYADEVQQLKAIGAAIAAARPETWKDRREADALVLYILSGGALNDVVPLVRGDAIVESERPLARGAVAYIMSHEADAFDLLGKLDLGGLDPRLAGPIAFALSVMQTKRNPKAAASFLDWARLVAPGGLVEEAALRRELALIVEAGDAPRVAMLTRRYAARFGASPYAADFLRELARTIARFGLVDDPANFQLLSDAPANLPPDARREFMLALAKAGIVNARFAAASAAAAEALRGAAPDSPDEARARLYLDAGRLFSDGYEAARADLRGIAAAKLNRPDAGLLASVRSVARQLRSAPSPGAIEAQGEASGKGPKAGADQTIERAEEALKRTERVADAGGASAP